MSDEIEGNLASGVIFGCFGLVLMKNGTAADTLVNMVQTHFQSRDAIVAFAKRA